MKNHIGSAVNDILLYTKTSLCFCYIMDISLMSEIEVYINRSTRSFMLIFWPKLKTINVLIHARLHESAYWLNSFAVNIPYFLI